MLYFAYGSNLNFDHLRNWLGRLEIDTTSIKSPHKASLRGYRFRTNYLRSGGLGAANIEPDDDGIVEGLIYEICPCILNGLRIKEGFPVRYEEIDVALVTENDENISALTYSVTPPYRLIHDQLVSGKYRSLILQGARQGRLSHDYLSLLASFLRSSKVTD